MSHIHALLLCTHYLGWGVGVYSLNLASQASFRSALHSHMRSNVDICIGHAPVAPCIRKDGLSSHSQSETFNTSHARLEGFLGHTPSTAGTFWKKFRKISGKTPETLSEFFLEFPSRVRLGSPKPYISRYLKFPEHFQNSLPPSTAGDASFFRKWFQRGPLRAGHGISELCDDEGDETMK